MMRRWEESFIVEMRDDDNERRCCSLFVALCQICVPLSKPVVQEDWISRAFGGFDGSPREEKQIGQSDRLAVNLEFLLRCWSCFSRGEKVVAVLDFLCMQQQRHSTTCHSTAHRNAPKRKCIGNDGQSDRLARNSKFLSHSWSWSWVLRGHKESPFEIHYIGGSHSFLPSEVTGEGGHIARYCLEKINFGNPGSCPA